MVAICASAQEGVGLRNVCFGSKADICTAIGHAAFPLKADMCAATGDVRFGPIADIALFRGEFDPPQ
jgi:hypothetical protein